MKLLFSADWLRRKIESDPDVECDAGKEIRQPPTTAMAVGGDKA
jgi:hypothetical protein